MLSPIRLFFLFSFSFCFLPLASAKEFTVLTYNVENLFDADGIAAYDDYKETKNPDSYNPSKMFGKIESIGKVLKSINDGQGPEIVAFSEIEMDFTPESTVSDYAQFLERYKETTAKKMLTSNVTPEVRGLPSEALLLKHLEDIGLHGYHVAIGADKPDLVALKEAKPGQKVRIKAQKNAVFSKFPITDVKSHSTQDARDILEVTLDVEGHPFTVFVNHWKSGAGRADTESTRCENAKTLRTRLEELLKNDPSADILLVGDFNSQYNQKLSYPEMEETGINDVLGSQGDEMKTATASGYSLYNLWYELPPEKRASDHFNGYWGTLMQNIITPGLYDHKGVQYVDNSFSVVVLDGVNAVTSLHIPRRWSNAGKGSGASDHFPISARFSTTEENDSEKRMSLDNPGTESDVAEEKPVFASLDLDSVPAFTSQIAFDVAQHIGEIFRVDASITSQKPLTVSANGKEYILWFDRKNSPKYNVLKSLNRGSKIEFVGQLNMKKNKFQFVIQNDDWILQAPEQK